jgi:hypothetical protein
VAGAFLRVIRPSHRALRFDGYLGSGQVGGACTRRPWRWTIDNLQFTHLLNVRALISPSFIDEDVTGDSVDRFINEVERQLEWLLAAKPRGLSARQQGY